MDTQRKTNQTARRRGGITSAGFRHASAALCCTLLALAALSCSGRSASPQLDAAGGLETAPPQQQLAPARPAIETAQPAGISLPAVDSLRSTSAAAPGRFATGAEVVPALLSANASVGGSTVSLQPNWDGTANFEPAWAGFELDMSGYSGSAELRNSLEDSGAGNPVLYYGLANWERGTWQWFSGEADGASMLPGFEPFIRAADQHMLVVVLVLATDASSLDWLRAGDAIAPIAVLKADVTSGPAPLAVVFDSFDCIDPDSGYAVSISPDGGPYVQMGSGYYHTYNSPGNFLASLRMESSDGMVAFDTVQITVDGYRPTARLTATPSIGQPGQMVNFDASGSFDQGGGIVSYSWDLDGDGNDDTGGPGVTIPSQQFMNVGTYHPRLTVTDNSGYTASEYVTIVIGMPIHETEPNDSQQDADHLPTVPFFNFLGDLGPTAPSGPGNEDWLHLRVVEPGLYHFTLYSLPVLGNVDIHLHDRNGGLIHVANNNSSSDEVFSKSLENGDYYLKVINSKPSDNAEYALVMSADFTALPVIVFNVTPDSGAHPLPVTLSAAGSYDPDGTIVKYEWDPYGDGHYEFDTGVTNQRSFTYKRRGTFTARLRVTDNMGASVVVTKTVSVSGPPLDEIEQNGTLASAQVLNLPVSGFQGDCGFGGQFSDGQNNSRDYFRINGLPGSGQVDLLLEFDDETALLRMRFYRVSMGNLLWIADSGPGMNPNQQVLGVLLSDPGDYAVIVGAEEGSSEYSLNVEHQ